METNPEEPDSRMPPAGLRLPGEYAVLPPNPQQTLDLFAGEWASRLPGAFALFKDAPSQHHFAQALVPHQPQDVMGISGVSGQCARNIKLGTSIVTHLRSMVTEDVEYLLRDNIDESLATERSAPNNVRMLLEKSYSFAAHAACVVGRLPTQWGHNLMTCLVQRLDEPEASERTPASEKYPQRSPRIRSIPWKSASRPGQFRSFSETSWTTAGQWTPIFGSSYRNPRSFSGE